MLIIYASFWDFGTFRFADYTHPLALQREKFLKKNWSVGGESA